LLTLRNNVKQCNGKKYDFLSYNAMKPGKSSLIFLCSVSKLPPTALQQKIGSSVTAETLKSNEVLIVRNVMIFIISMHTFSYVYTLISWWLVC
jgi:hypothetical protein